MFTIEPQPSLSFFDKLIEFSPAIFIILFVALAFWYIAKQMPTIKTKNQILYALLPIVVALALFLPVIYTRNTAYHLHHDNQRVSNIYVMLSFHNATENDLKVYIDHLNDKLTDEEKQQILQLQTTGKRYQLEFKNNEQEHVVSHQHGQIIKKTNTLIYTITEY